MASPPSSSFVEGANGSSSANNDGSIPPFSTSSKRDVPRYQGSDNSGSRSASQPTNKRQKTTTRWSIPLTAPEFTPIQEQEERDNLPEDEREYLRKELYGLDEPMELAREQEYVKQFMEYVHSRVLNDINVNNNNNNNHEESSPGESDGCNQATGPKNEYCDKQAYLEALERCPDVLEQETSPLMFLKSENFDVKSAVMRLLAYWKVRKDLFGEELAFLPMTLDGAMREDLDEVKRGFMTVLPEDEHGRPVVLLDRVGSTRSTTYQRKSYLRTLWYMFHCVSQDAAHQRKGYVFVLNLIDWDPHKSGDRIGAKMCFVIIRECVPLKLKAYHATYGSKQTPVKIVEPHIRQMQGKEIRLHLVHHYGTDEDNLKSMARYGLLKEHLPACVGGDVDLKKHLAWLQGRDQYEANLNRTPCAFEADLVKEFEEQEKRERVTELKNLKAGHDTLRTPSSQLNRSSLPSLNRLVLEGDKKRTA